MLSEIEIVGRRAHGGGMETGVEAYQLTDAELTRFLVRDHGGAGVVLDGSPRDDTRVRFAHGAVEGNRIGVRIHGTGFGRAEIIERVRFVGNDESFRFEE